jgi:hypothetical protein
LSKYTAYANFKRYAEEDLKDWGDEGSSPNTEKPGKKADGATYCK